MRRFYLEANVEATSAQFHLTTPEVLHLILLQVMGLDHNHNIGGYPMSSLSMVHLTPLSNYDSSVARVWDTLLEGDSTPSMHNTAEFLQDNGATSIK